MTVLQLSDLDLSGKRVLIREDLNVPLDAGRVTSDARIRAALPTLEQALAANAAVIVMSHLGRPEEGIFDPRLSLGPVAQRLGELMGRPIPLLREWIEGVEVAPGELVLCENVRFLKGEKADDESLSRKMANLCDVFVMDAFGTAHRAQASTHGVGMHAPVACAGPLLAAELDALAQALESPRRPLVAVVGGSKVSTKLSVLNSLAAIVDQLIVGGGIANTFIAAAGLPIGKSLAEHSRIADAKRLMDEVKARGGGIPIPSDVVCATEFASNAPATLKPVAEVADGDLILDIGPRTSERLCEIIDAAGTVVWNGPVGVFEFDQFGQGTEVIAKAIATSNAFSIAGGGDTLAAIDKYGVAGDVSYISTGGGAFLEFVEGKTLPAVAMLQQRAADARTR